MIEVENFVAFGIMAGGDPTQKTIFRGPWAKIEQGGWKREKFNFFSLL
jgi:hypothetical protein